MTQNKINPPTICNNRYDEMPYVSHAISASFPNHLEAIGKLFNLQPPPISNARILEIGCASGGNIIPLACYNPNMEIIGIDYSEKQIQEGLLQIQQLNLKNISLLHANINDDTKHLGSFDYIICHGVYSWVSSTTQEEILKICHEHLSEHGIAYISYNTYPGWKINEISRDAMMFHTRNIHTVKDQLNQGFNILKYLHSVADEHSIFNKIISHQINFIEHSDAHYIAHEYLETENHPCYFKEFVERAEHHQLTYLAESSIATMFATNLSDQQREQLAIASEHNQVNLEQYLDFVYNRSFRQTLLCKKQHATNILYNIQPEKLTQLCYTTPLRFAQEHECQDLPQNRKKYIHRSHPSSTVIIDKDAEGATMIDLLISSGERPIHYETILTTVKKQLPQATLVEEKIKKIIYELSVSGNLIVYAHEILIPKKDNPLDYPKINTQIISYALVKGFLPTPNHNEIKLDPFLVTLLPLLDGTYDIENLKIQLIAAEKEQAFFFTHEKTQTRITDQIALEEIIQQHLINTLHLLNHHALLL